jgi:hypothetical protein
LVTYYVWDASLEQNWSASDFDAVICLVFLHHDVGLDYQ